MPKDHITGRNKGHAVITFRKHKYAKAAAKEMNGFDINGRKLKVQIMTEATTKMMNTKGDYDLEEDHAN